VIDIGAKAIADLISVGLIENSGIPIEVGDHNGFRMDCLGDSVIALLDADDGKSEDDAIENADDAKGKANDVVASLQLLVGELFTDKDQDEK
jgi:hypothetical protein